MKSIYVTYQTEGMHKYLGAPEGVEFLRSLHRHMFQFRVELEVERDDRELEFILVKRDLEVFTEGLMLSMPETYSCEQIAGEIVKYLVKAYGKRTYKVDVSEDGENGVVVYSNRTPAP